MVWRIILFCLLSGNLAIGSFVPIDPDRAARDNLNRLTNVIDWASRKTTSTYDLAGRLTTLTRPNGTYSTISYDADGEVTNIWEQMASGLPIAWFRLNWTNTGNMLWEFAAPLPHTNSPGVRQMTYNADNELASFKGPGMTSYQNVGSDLDGNLTSAPLPIGSSTVGYFTNLTYDARNRLLNAGGVTNFYDALNNRVSQNVGTNTTTYVINPNAALPQVLMRVKNGVTTYYIYGAGLMYQITEGVTVTNTLSYHYDYRGSTVALSADNGLVTDRIEYSLYGSTTYRFGTNDTPFLFDGQYGVQTDANGLLYMQARYCNPYLCRFISPDPSGFAGGLNFYAYANGNPVSYIDPFGLGALGESALTSSWFDAPTAQQTAIQNGLADFANIATLGIADAVSSATTGKDLQGNNLDFGDAFQQTLQAGVFVGALALSLPTDGGSLEADSALGAANGLKTGADEAVFWSGIRNGDSVAAGWIGQNGGATLETTLAARGIKLPVWDSSNPVSVAAWRQASKNFAAGASGNIRVLQSGTVRVNSVWAEVEFPALKANRNVSTIRAVDPQNGTETLLWSR